jgi:hypothetical protein
MGKPAGRQGCLKGGWIGEACASSLPHQAPSAAHLGLCCRPVHRLIGNPPVVGGRAGLCCRSISYTGSPNAGQDTRLRDLKPQLSGHDNEEVGVLGRVGRAASSPDGAQLQWCVVSELARQ